MIILLNLSSKNHIQFMIILLNLRPKKSYTIHDHLIKSASTKTYYKVIYFSLPSL